MKEKWRQAQRNHKFGATSRGLSVVMLWDFFVCSSNLFLCSECHLAFKAVEVARWKVQWNKTVFVEHILWKLKQLFFSVFLKYPFAELFQRVFDVVDRTGQTFCLNILKLFTSPNNYTKYHISNITAKTFFGAW